MAQNATQFAGRMIMVDVSRQSRVLNSNIVEAGLANQASLILEMQHVQIANNGYSILNF